MCEILKGKADAMTLEASKLSSSFDTAPLPKQGGGGGGGYQICFASLRTSLNSTFSGSPAFNESFAPVFLYQDGCKVRHPRAILLDNDITNTHIYYFSIIGHHLCHTPSINKHLSVQCLLCYCLCPIDGLLLIHYT